MAPRTPLLRPAAYFRDRDPASVLRAMGLVLLFVLVTTASLTAFGWVVADGMTGTEAIDNPERPPDWVCDDESGPDWDRQREGCDEPETVEVERSELMWDGFTSAIASIFPVLLAGSYLAWLLYGVALHVAAAVAGGRGEFSRALSLAGWGFVATLGQVVVVFAALLVALRGETFAGSPDAFTGQLEAAVAGVDWLLTGAALALFGWETYIWTYGLSSGYDLRVRPATVAAGAVAFLELLFYLA